MKVNNDKLNSISSKAQIETISTNPVEDYLKELNLLGRRPSYITRIKGALRDFAKSVKSNDAEVYDVPIIVTEHDVKKWVENMKKYKKTNNEPLSYAYITHQIRTLNTFYEFIVQSPDYDIHYNPVSRINKLFSHNNNNQTYRPIKSLEEMSRFIHGITNIRDRAIVVTFCKTLIRDGELAVLTIDDVDFDNFKIIVDKHLDNITKEIVEGRKNGTKTEIPMDGELYNILNLYAGMRPEPKSKVFFQSNRGKLLHPTTISTVIVKPWAVRLGMCKNSNKTSEKITPHYFRAWGGYQMEIVNGCNPTVIEIIRGDKTKTMRSFYASQVVSFENLRNEYLRKVPKFG